MKEQTTLKKTDILRQAAEKLLNEREEGIEVPFPETFNLKLIHELKMHQVELELQNEELTLAKEDAELAEKKYAELYDFAPIGYLSLSKAGDIIDLNMSAGRLLGKEDSGLVKSRFGFFISTDMRPYYNYFLKEVFETNLKQTCELKLVTEDDSIKYVLVSGITSYTKEKCLLTLTDITTQKQVEKELIEAREKAEESDRLKSAFLANMSHEIRTPMNGILGFTELLRTMELTVKERQRYIQIIEKSGHRMLNIINDIITISRIEAEQVKIEVSNTNVNKLLGEIRSFFKPEAEQKEIHFFINNVLPENDPFIRTDSEKLYAVLTNLVKNAIKFTPSGTVELGCETKGEFIEFYVKDSGYGISEEQIGYIFDRFRQGSDLLTPDHQGSGLGLAISKAYVELLGGEIWAESESDSHQDGKGSIFRFTIPNLSVIEKKEKRRVVVEQKVSSDLKLKVLVVDDDENSRMLIGHMLKDFKSQIIVATSGSEAILTCRQNPDINLILMDIKMHGMDGYEATRKIREFNKEVIIVAQTAFALDSDREEAINAGCNNYISKPINRVALKDLISQYLS